jgi:uncharacterized DUF497 family protein
MTAPSEIAAQLGIPEGEFRIVPGRTKIEYDPGKNDKNRSTHKFDLESATHLLSKWVTSPYQIITSEGYPENDEVRHMHLVQDDDKRILMIVTTKRSGETIRIISLRSASQEEQATFNKYRPQRQT